MKRSSPSARRTSRSLIRPLVEELHAYVPGEQPRIKGLIKLNTNENPYPPSPKVIAAIKAAVDGRLRLYPNPAAQALREKPELALEPSSERPNPGVEARLILTLHERGSTYRGADDYRDEACSELHREMRKRCVRLRRKMSPFAIAGDAMND